MMLKFSSTFLGKSLSDKGEPSSKRFTGFIIVSFALIMEFITLILETFTETEGMGYDVFVTLLIAGLSALGISGIEKLKKP